MMFDRRWKMTPDNVAGRAGPMVIVIAAAIMLAGIVSRPAAALDLETALARVPVQAVFPSAEKVGPAEGSPPAAAVFRDRKLIGYVFLTSDVVASVGYAGKPVEIMVGLDLDGHLAGAVVVAHQEPILILGIKDSRLGEFTAQYAGIDIRKRVRLGRASGDDEVGVDMVSGASITSAVFSDSILRSARLIARARGIIARGGGSGG
ncbi:MAG: FMN-binding protein, partial [Candidatus Magasanikbacteria bacterium]|nr:FMN-binding protein [Candidatus Magasanikbacteria bacterium]